MEVWKIMFLSKWVICRFHVNLPGCRLDDFCCETVPSGTTAKMYLSSIQNINWLSRWFTFTLTPLKFNMDPANQPLEKGDSLWKPSFSVSMLSFWGCM